MIHTTHWEVGDTGQYFYFSEKDSSQMFGDGYWDGMVFNVTQKGSHDWSGEVEAYQYDPNGDKGVMHPNGRRHPKSKSSPGQWAAGDTIQLQSCVSPGT